MNYHNITKDDMNNGSGLRVVLWLSGCNHQCEGCHNKETWNCESGIPFDIDTQNEILNELEKEYVTGITFSGGDPLHENNLKQVLELIKLIKTKYPKKTIWLYTGYTWETLSMRMKGVSEMCIRFNTNTALREEIIAMCDVMVDGRFVKKDADVNYQWAGSTNQRVIDVNETLKNNQIVLWHNKR